MKLSVDAKFLTTALITFAVLVIVIAAVNAVAGAPVAMVAAAAVGTISVKLFDKFEYHPTSEIAFGAPLISVPLIYAALASAMLLNGASIGVDFLVAALAPGPQGDICRATVLIPLLFLDWGGFALSGWLVGRLFPHRALGLATFAGILVVAVSILRLRHPDLTAYARVASCMSDKNPLDDLEGKELSFRIGSALGIASRAYVALAFARIATQRHRQPQAIGAPTA